MLFLNLLLDLIHRLSHPVSSPVDIANDLGLNICGRITIEDLIRNLRKNHPTKLQKQMAKGAADAIFTHALRKDIFKESSRFSYIINQVRFEFVLDYDSDCRLKSAILHIQRKHNELNLELQLEPCPYLWKQAVSP